MSEQPSMPKEKNLKAASCQHLEGDIYKITYQKASRQTVLDIFALLDDIMKHYTSLESVSNLNVGILIDDSQAPPQSIAHLVNRAQIFSQKWKLREVGSIRPDSTIRLGIIYDPPKKFYVHMFATMFAALRWRQFEMRTFKEKEQETVMPWLRYEES